MKIYLLGICFIFIEGCTQHKNIGWSNISCDYSSSHIVQYSLESLDRDYNCKEVAK